MKEQENDRKKRLFISIFGVLLLIIVIVGISFAMFTFTGTGTKDNVITTGTVTISFDKVEGGTKENYFSVDNEYPKTDARGIKDATAKADFAIVGTWSGDPNSMTIDYDLGISNISEGKTLTSDMIKIVLYKENQVVIGETQDGKLIGGATIASRKDIAGDNNLLKNYALSSGTLTTSNIPDKYQILAWVSDKYNLPTDINNTDVENGGKLSRSTVHKKATESETYSFKLMVSAKQRSS